MTSPASPIHESTRDRLARRRVELTAQSAQLRGELARQSEVLATPLAIADGVRLAGLWVRDHPLVVVVAVSVLLIWRPRRLVTWPARAWTAWRWWSRLRPTVSRMMIVLRG